jgi:COMPASS component SWD1
VRATLDSGAVIARFDRTGRFVAAGLRDGSVFLWDLATQAVVRNLEGHVRMITGLSYAFLSCVMAVYLGLPTGGLATLA